MKRLNFLCCLIALLTASALAHEAELLCRHGWQSYSSAPAATPGGRNYAPDRKADILHLVLDVTPDFKQRTVTGIATLKFKPIAKPLQELRLDAVDLRVLEITGSEKVASHFVESDQVVIAFESPIPADMDASVSIRYSAEPDRGLYFRTSELGYKAEDTHLWTQGESILARHWYPSYDFPNEKFTSEIICHVPEGMVVLSNGRKISEATSNRVTTVQWLQDKPHVNYLISLVAGHFKSVEDSYNNIPLAFWTPTSAIREAPNSFRDTKDMMAFFEKEIGVPYPWAKYDQVCVEDFGWGGMENTSITTLNINTLFTTATENIRSSQPLVAHELAHQWFGDLVTCKDWSHVWLNEGFATYYDLLYDGHKAGQDQFLYRLYEGAKSILAQTNDTKAIVNRTFGKPDEQFNYLAYGKGSWVLHMLRSQLGPDLYRKCVQTFLERHAYGTAVTEDLNSVIEELSGRSFDQFFDQWVYHARQPELEVNYSWDEQSKLAKVTIDQVQPISQTVLLFNFPLKLRFKTTNMNERFYLRERAFTVTKKVEDFYVPLPSAPQVVRIDPELTLLAKINFSPSTALLEAQLEDTSDVVGRLLAVDQLAKRKDQSSVSKLKRVLNEDRFYGVRINASKALRSIHTPEAREALLASTKQDDARVRRQAVLDATSFYHETSYDLALRVLGEEKNPDILAVALTSLAGYARPAVKEVLTNQLASQSHRNHLAESAIQAVRLQNDPTLLPAVIETLKQREPEFTSRTMASGLETVAYLAKEQENKDSVWNFLSPFVGHPKTFVRLAAIAALGTLGDPQGLPVLEKFASAAKETAERMAAEKAIADIRGGRKSSAELGTLRAEVLELQKQNRDFQREIDGLKKRFEAEAPKTTPTLSAPPLRPKKKR